MMCSIDVYMYYALPGYECEAHNNPPDFFLDVINGDSSAVKFSGGGGGGGVGGTAGELLHRP